MFCSLLSLICNMCDEQRDIKRRVDTRMEDNRAYMKSMSGLSEVAAAAPIEVTSATSTLVVADSRLKGDS